MLISFGNNVTVSHLTTYNIILTLKCESIFQLKNLSSKRLRNFLAILVWSMFQTGVCANAALLTYFHAGDYHLIQPHTYTRSKAWTTTQLMSLPRRTHHNGWVQRHSQDRDSAAPITQLLVISNFRKALFSCFLFVCFLHFFTSISHTIFVFNNVYLYHSFFSIDEHKHTDQDGGQSETNDQDGCSCDYCTALWSSIFW